MARLSPLVALPPLAFAAIAGMFLWGMGRDDPDALPSALIGREAPTVPATTLPGRTQLTDDMLRAPGVKLVNFWASWCPPCRAEHPTLTSLSHEMPVYGIDLKDPPSNATEFLDEHGDPFRALATDPSGRAAIDWGVTAPPETFIIDGEGRILHRHAGPLIREDYTNRFLPELEKAREAAR
ncbi:DsbE family thiol:disulfide interchange protein [Paracoccus sp. R12_1]|uniref:DsbE family thiol:disulfide interchange protein n=1 Tax=Paracoccus maritimus TaxID=2933292 RepID=A0ABT2K7J7_9RHOB|nr:MULTISPECIES: DsbE family thiol:disulfide interchange protein [unclassified Paracoccus (in: a-proteobacteria)]MBO9455383.1 DsbE family thiol:disulfide interchange protein [Paracoccus sp. R12_2]MBO9485863.1 DsbE family thiol:disulfide interchange protein [Paracoccus sp. R12_1]MCT4331879.1 DsbE family thiol:disulfide interchange protein [Paracoccus sp. YLB-12]